jgi:thiamine transporter ThiT
MFRRVLIGFLVSIPAYAVGAAAGYFVISVSSANQHDRAIEAAMTGAFVTGPLLAIVGFAAGVAFTGRKPSVPSPPPD